MGTDEFSRTVQPTFLHTQPEAILRFGLPFSKIVDDSHLAIVAMETANDRM
jgi:hypothetical protein